MSWPPSNQVTLVHVHSGTVVVTTRAFADLMSVADMAEYGIERHDAPPLAKMTPGEYLTYNGFSVHEIPDVRPAAPSKPYWRRFERKQRAR
jgi:hypothetical protein